MPAFFLGLLEQHAHRFSCEQGVAHATPPSGRCPCFRECLPIWLYEHCRGLHAAPLQENSIIPCCARGRPAATITSKRERPGRQLPGPARPFASDTAAEQT